MKKFKIFMLTLLMVLTLLPVNTLADEDTSSQELDFTVYASISNLTYNEVYGNLANEKAKIVFGKDTNSKPLEWYLSGNDGEGKPNILIFSASPIAKLQFNNSTVDNNYNYDENTGYGESSGSITVSANHYGASDIRKALQDIAKDTRYFSQVEQNLMMESTIKTKDTNHIIEDSNVLYTTSDKLYLPSFREDKTSDNKTYVYVTFGSRDGKTIDLQNLKNIIPSSSLFLRDPASSSTDIYVCAYANNEFTISSTAVTNPTDVYVATNLNANDILFASSAEAGKTSKIDTNTAMTLRLDGANKNIGKVVYYPNDTIEVTKGSANNVTLMIQGKNNDVNWSYSKAIDQDTTVSKLEIIDELNNKVYVDNQAGGVSGYPIKISDIDLAYCEIWLETTATDGMIYAVESKEAVTSINITDIDAPVATQALDEEAKCQQRGVHLPKHTVEWEPADTIAKYNEIYTANITLEAPFTFEFLQNVNVTVNGEKANIISNDGYNITVSYTFSKTNDKLVSATNPNPITVENGTALEDMKIPETVTVETAGKSTTSLKVNWILDQVTNYDPNSKHEQILTIPGIVELPENILAISNDGPAVVEIKVIVKAAEIVSTSTPNTTVTDDGYVVPNTGVK